MVQLTDQNSLERRQRELQLDKEWVLLIKSAKKQGLSIDEVRKFLKEKNRHLNASRN